MLCSSHHFILHSLLKITVQIIKPFQAFLLINLLTLRLNHWEAMWKNGVVVNIKSPFCFQLLFRDFTNNLKRKWYFSYFEE